MKRLDYNLCKKLKDAGFKNTEAVKWFLFPNKELLPHPTLSELIEAVGDKFESILHFGGKWQTNRVSPEAEYRIEDVMWYETPEEAVANLWLKLNKK